MKKRHGIRQSAATVFIAAVLLAGCADDPQALVASAKALLAKKDNSAAIIKLKNALQKDLDNAEARFLLGKALLDSGDALGAEKALRMARELHYPPQDVAPPFARSLVRLGRYKEVIDELSSVEIEARPGKAELMTAVGQAHLGLGNAAAAQAAFTTALAAQPEYVPAHLGQARLAASIGNFPQALAAVDSALRISPGDADAWQLKGDILRAQEQPAQALAAYGKAAEAKPGFVAAHSAMVSMLLQQKRPEDAAKQVEVMKQVAPKHPDTLYLQALMAYRTGDFSGARERIQQHLRASPDSLLGLMLAGSIELELKSYAQAEGHLLKALQLAPRLRLARSTLIVTYLRKREVGKALDALMPVLEHIGKDAGMLALAGEVFMMNGDITRGAEYFAKAAALDPGDATKQTAVAMSHMAMGKFDEGMRELEPVAASDSGIRADLALIAGLMQRRQYDKALAAIAALEKKEPAARWRMICAAVRCWASLTPRERASALSALWSWTWPTSRQRPIWRNSIWPTGSPMPPGSATSASSPRIRKTCRPFWRWLHFACASQAMPVRRQHPVAQSAPIWRCLRSSARRSRHSPPIRRRAWL